MNLAKKFLRRPQAAEYLHEKYGFGSYRSLAKLACTGGGPVYHKFGGVVLYDADDLDSWVASRIKRQAATGVAA